MFQYGDHSENEACDHKDRGKKGAAAQSVRVIGPAQIGELDAGAVGKQGQRTENSRHDPEDGMFLIGENISSSSHGASE